MHKDALLNDYKYMFQKQVDKAAGKLLYESLTMKLGSSDKYSEYC